MRINLLAAMTRIANKQKNNKQINKQKKNARLHLMHQASNIKLEKYIINSIYVCIIANYIIGLGINTSMAVLNI